MSSSENATGRNYPSSAVAARRGRRSLASRRVTRRLALPAAVLVALALAGCGGGGSSDAGSAGATTSAAPSPTPPATTEAAPKDESGLDAERKPTTPFTIKVDATGHRPVAGEDWTFTVSAKNADGTPTDGTVRAYLLLDGKLYDTIGWYLFQGDYHRTIQFPLERKDLPLVFRVQVEANGGLKNARDYPIKVQ
jgi:hypothetical protein